MNSQTVEKKHNIYQSEEMLISSKKYGFFGYVIFLKSICIEDERITTI